MAQRKGSGTEGTPVGGPRAVDQAAPVGAADEIEATDAVKATSAATQVGRASAAAGVDAVSAVAAALRSGKLTVAEAVDRLIDDAVQKQVGRAIEPGSEVEARLRRVLRDHAGADPLISAKIRRLEGRRPGR